MNLPSTFTFNGMLKTNEIAEEGNSFSTEFRQYDPRLGKWISLDPLMEQFPWMSPFVGFDNNPILYVDPWGLESTTDGDDKKKDGDKKGTEKENKDSYIDKDGKLIPDKLGLPENPEEGKTYKGSNGKNYSNIDGTWTGTTEDAEVHNGKSKGESESKKKGYDWLKGDYMYAFKGFYDGGKSQAFKETIQNQPLWRQEIWKNKRAQGETLDKATAIMLTAPVAIVTAVETAPVWAPHVWNLAKGYHNTFGVNGGYQNTLINTIYQTATSPGSNFEYSGFLISGFTPSGTALWKQGLVGISSSYVSVTSDGVKLSGVNTYSTLTAYNNMLIPVLGNSHFGNSLSSNFIFGSFQLFINTKQKSENEKK